MTQPKTTRTPHLSSNQKAQLMKTIPLPIGVCAALIELLGKASVLVSIKHECGDLSKTIGEAMAIEVEHGTGESTLEALLYELLEAVALESGRRFALTADRAGVAAAKLTLADMGPAVGATQEQAALAVIREALRAPRLTYVLEDRDGRRLEGVGDCYALPRVGEILALEVGRYKIYRVTHTPGVPVATIMVAPLPCNDCEDF